MPRGFDADVERERVADGRPRHRHPEQRRCEPRRAGARRVDDHAGPELEARPFIAAIPCDDSLEAAATPERAGDLEIVGGFSPGLDGAHHRLEHEALGAVHLRVEKQHTAGQSRRLQLGHQGKALGA